MYVGDLSMLAVFNLNFQVLKLYYSITYNTITLLYMCMYIYIYIYIVT